MDDINEKILKTLQKEVDTNIAREDQITVLQLLSRGFKGPMWLTGSIVILFQIIFAGLALYFAFHMFYAQEVTSKINWFLGVIVTFIPFVALRLWLFMELNRLSVVREVKRVELQLSLLTQKISEK